MVWADSSEGIQKKFTGSGNIRHGTILGSGQSGIKMYVQNKGSENENDNWEFWLILVTKLFKGM